MIATNPGRDLTTFEMMAHHAFNIPDEEISWKGRIVEFCDQFIVFVGGDIRKVTYKENPWIGINARKARGCRGNGFEGVDAWYADQLA